MLRPIHDCVQTSLENDYFREKLTEYFKENRKLKEELKQLQNENELLKTKPSKTETSTQTKELVDSKTSDSNENVEISKPSAQSSSCSVCVKQFKTKSNLPVPINQQVTSKKPIAQPVNSFDKNIYNQQNKKSYVKLCEMQHNLLKKYENEVNSNAVKQDLINHMKIELDQLESKCEQLGTENTQLKTRLEELDELEAKFKTLVLDLEKSKLKCKKYKNELKCFDENFFQELEDLKYNFYESIKLNEHYEKLLYNLQKKNLIVSRSKKKSKGNRVKFALNDQDEASDCENQINEGNDVDSNLSYLKKLKDSFRSINEDYEAKSSLDQKEVDNSCDETNDSEDFDFDKLRLNSTDSIDELIDFKNDFYKLEEKPQTEQFSDLDLDETFDYEKMIDKLK